MQDCEPQIQIACLPFRQGYWNILKSGKDSIFGVATTNQLSFGAIRQLTRKLITSLPQAGIHQNPVEEGLVFKAEDYVYSSAIDYAGEKGMLDVILIK